MPSGRQVKNLNFEFVMLLTPHAVVGATIGASTDNLPLIIILAFLGHFVLDMLPHADWGMWHDYDPNFKMTKKDYILVLADILGVLIITYILWHHADRNNNILIGAFFAMLVDLIDSVPFWKYYLRRIRIFGFLHKYHFKWHFKIKPKYWYWGVLIQTVIIISSILIIFNN